MQPRGFIFRYGLLGGVQFKIWALNDRNLGPRELRQFLGAPASNAGATLILWVKREGRGDISFFEYIDHCEYLNALTILSAMLSVWIFWNFLESFGILRNFLESSWFLWILLESFGMFWNLLESFGFFWNLLESFGIIWNHLESFGIFWNILESFGIFWNLFDSWVLQTHASPCQLMPAQMLRMCSGDARAMLKLELFGALGAENVFFESLGRLRSQEYLEPC